MMTSRVDAVTQSRTLRENAQAAYATLQGWVEAYRQWSDERDERNLQRRRELLAGLERDEPVRAKVPAQPEPRADESDALYLDAARPACSRSTVALQRVGLLDGLRRLLEEEALIVLGPKGSGKTTLSLALLNAVIAAGHHGVPTYGAGLNYAEIDRTLKALFDEMRLRYQRGQEGRREPMYVFIDEVPSIRDECPSWGRVFAKLLREARKVNIHLVVLSQSFLVEDLGINGDTRANLTVVALGKAVTRYLSKAQHLNDREKPAFIEATRSLPRPAVIDSGDVPAIFEVAGADRVQTRVQPRPWRFEDGDESELLAGLLVGQQHTSIAGLEGRTRAEISSSAQTSMAGIADMEAVNGGMSHIENILGDMSRDEKMALLVRLGVSGNAIVAAVGGDRNAVLARVRELRGGQEG
jgi:energy-coupling factor transporter ATP-binding protein EcfA2